MTNYAELQCTSNFSFLRGASHPEEIAMQAKHLGLSAIAVTDRNTLAGVVRAPVGIEVVSADQVTYREFLNSIPTPSLLYIVTITR